MAEKGPASLWGIENTWESPRGYVFVPVTSFVAVQGSAVGDIDLSWSNPTHPDYVRTIIRRKEGSYPTSPTDGDPVYSGGAEAVTDSGLPTGITYYYAAFTEDVWGVFSNGALTSGEPLPPDLAAPSPIENFTATPGPANIQLTWDNPVDPDYAGVMIRRRSDGSYPAGITDGDLVYDGTGESVLDEGLNHTLTYKYSAFAYDAPIQGPPPNYGSPEQAEASPDQSTPTEVRVDEIGLLEAMVGAIAESDAEIGGQRITRLTAVANPGDTSVQVETTLDWPDAGSIAIGGVRYRYAGKTYLTFTGLTHVSAGATVAGVKNLHHDESAVVDISKEWSALEQLRRAMLVEYAEGEDLNAIGRNLGVNRLPIFEDDDQFREMIKVMAYNPKGTYWGLEQALTGLVGAGNFEIIENMIQYPNTVFIKLTGAAVTLDEAQGKAILNLRGYSLVDDGGIGLDKVPVPEYALTVGSVRLQDLNESFDLKTAIPSGHTYEHYPDQSPEGDSWTYLGGLPETQVILSSEEYTLFDSSAPTMDTVFYRMTDVNGARVTDKSYAEINALAQIETVLGIVESGKLGQLSWAIYDDNATIHAGVDVSVATNQYKIGLYKTEGGGFIGNTATLTEGQYYDIALRKYQDQFVELWVDGQLVAREDYSQFVVGGSVDHFFEFGIRTQRTLGTPTSLHARVKRLGVFAKTPTDYWSLQASGNVVAANPNRLTKTTGVADFIAGDVGKRVYTSDSQITNPNGGNNNGSWTVESFVDASNVELVGDTWEDAYVESATPNRIYLADREFTYPDDLGKKIVLEGGSYAGTYTINDLRDPDDPTKSLNDWDTPLRTKTHICEVASAGFVTNESGIDVHLEPNFADETTLEFELSDAGELTGTSPNQVADLRQDLWASDLVMQIIYTTVLSAQVLPVSQILNNVVSEGPPPVFSYWPFYINDPLGIVQAYLDTVTAAGVIPEYLIE